MMQSNLANHDARTVSLLRPSTSGSDLANIKETKMKTRNQTGQK